MTARLEVVWHPITSEDLPDDLEDRHELTQNKILSSAKGELLYLFAHELREVRDEIAVAIKHGVVTKRLIRLRWQIVNVMSLCYCLRERLIIIASAIAERDGIGAVCRKRRNLRQDTDRDKLREDLNQLLGNATSLVDPIFDLLVLINPEIETRNDHIHRSFISIELCIYQETRGNDGKLIEEEWIDVRDPEDILVELTGKPAKQREFRAFVLKSLQNLASEYRKKIDGINAALEVILDRLEKLEEVSLAGAEGTARVLSFTPKGQS